MYRQKLRRPSVARVIGAVLVAVAYGSLVAWAGNLAQAEPSTVAGATAAFSAPVTQSSADMSAAGAEAPLATLAIALTLASVGGAWYFVGSLRRKHPLARRARLVVRYLTTLV